MKFNPSLCLMMIFWHLSFMVLNAIDHDVIGVSLMTLGGAFWTTMWKRSSKTTPTPPGGI